MTTATLRHLIAILAAAACLVLCALWAHGDTTNLVPRDVTITLYDRVITQDPPPPVVVISNVPVPCPPCPLPHVTNTPPPVNATPYRVGTGQPYSTIAAALAAAPSGALVEVYGGTYAGFTINKPVTIRGIGTTKPVITASNADGGPESVIQIEIAASGTRLENLDIWGGSYYCIKLNDTWSNRTGTGASRITILNCKIHDSGRDCIKVTPGCDDVSILNCEIYRSGQRDPSNAEGIDNVNGDRMIVRGNHIHDIATKGVYAKGGAKDALIEGNRFERVAGPSVCLGSHTDAPWFDADNATFTEAIRGIVRSNTMTSAGGMYAQACDGGTFAANTGTGLTTAGLLLDTPQTGTQPSRNITVTGNSLVTAARPNIEVRVNGWNKTGSFTGNRYDLTNGKPWFKLESWSGDLAGWKTRSGTDADATEINP